MIIRQPAQNQAPACQIEENVSPENVVASQSWTEFLRLEADTRMESEIFVPGTTEPTIESGVGLVICARLPAEPAKSLTLCTAPIYIAVDSRARMQAPAPGSR